MNILIVKLSAIGDVIHTLPSLTALRKLYPEAHITWIIEEASADLIQNHPHLDHIIVSGRKRWIKEIKTGRPARPLKEIRAFIQDIRQQKYDLVIDFHGLLKSAVIVWLSGGKRKLGYASMQELSGLFLNEKIPEDMSKHAVDRYLDFPRHLGAVIKGIEFLIPITDTNKSKVDALLMENGIGEAEAFAAVNPTALWETKLWDDDQFARLCDRLIAETGMKVLFTDAGPEKIEAIQTRMKQPAVNLGGRTSLRDLAYLYRRAAFLITTDSGPMHLAAAMGTPVCALFGPTDPKRTGPYGDGHVVIQKNMSCSPCFKRVCPDRTCMREITAAEVYKRIEEKFLKPAL
ncbi:MAG: glycosyltransferase family 9 protein [Deltaproteobacteria bacterium]|nr:glycosyltransferase family 9 protein [Deltaproteobacteria bacterium]